MEDRQAALQRADRASAREVRQAQKSFQSSLHADRRQRVQEAGETIEAFIEFRNIQEAWDHILQWYRQVKGRKDPLNRGAL